MCEVCHNELQSQLAKRNWTPTEQEIGDFLWSGTCFPFGDGETIAASIRDAFNRFGDAGSFAEFSNAAAAYADECMTEANEEYKHSYAEQPEAL